MAVSGSGSFENPFEGQQPATPGAKHSAANEAAHKKNRQADATFYNPKGPVPVEGSLASAKRSKEEEYLAKQQAKYIRFMQGKMPAEEFMASFRGVDAATIKAARSFAQPRKSDFMSASELEKARAEEKFIKATKGATAARDFRLKNIIGLSDQSIEEIRQFDTPEPSKDMSMRNTVFGGFSAFGLVQAALSSFANSLKIATETLNTFISKAVLGDSPDVSFATAPFRAGLAAAPGALIAAGAVTGAASAAVTGAAAPVGGLVGGAMGFVGGTILKSAFDPLLQAFESFDSAIQQYTDSLIGISPAVTQVSIEQTIRRFERQFERSDVAGERLASISEARFRLEEAFYTRATQLIIAIGPYIENLFNNLAAIIDDPTEFVRIVGRALRGQT